MHMDWSMIQDLHIYGIAQLFSKSPEFENRGKYGKEEQRQKCNHHQRVAVGAKRLSQGNHKT